MTEQNATGPGGVYRPMHAHSATTSPPLPPATVPVPGGDDPEPVPRGASTFRTGPADSAFSEFYRTTWPGVARALAVALGDRDLAVDATDEAMARAYPGGPPSPATTTRAPGSTGSGSTGPGPTTAGSAAGCRSATRPRWRPSRCPTRPSAPRCWPCR